MCRHLDVGLAPSLEEAASAGPRKLVAALGVPATDGPYAVAPVGRQRAMDMAVNVVLPALHAWAAERRLRGRQVQYQRLYLAFPSLQENTITREARRCAGNPVLEALSLDACMQQGLVHLYQRAVGQSGGKDVLTSR